MRKRKRLIKYPNINAQCYNAQDIFPDTVKSDTPSYPLGHNVRIHGGFGKGWTHATLIEKHSLRHRATLAKRKLTKYRGFRVNAMMPR